MKTVLLGCLLVAGVAGCGSSADRLSAAQIGKVTDSLDSVGRAQKASESAQGGVREAALATGSVSQTATGSLDDAGLRLAQKLRASTCQYHFQPPSSTAAGFDYALSVSGSSCPMSLDYAISFQNSLFELRWTEDTQFKITDPQLVALNDIDSFSLHGGMDASPTVDSSSSTPTFKLDGTLAMSGAAHSQKYGDIKITIDGGISGQESQSAHRSHSEVTVTLAFSDFSAELKQVVDSDGDSTTKTYSLNGDTLTEEQFQGYLSRAGNVFSQPFASAGR